MSTDGGFPMNVECPVCGNWIHVEGYGEFTCPNCLEYQSKVEKGGLEEIVKTALLLIGLPLYILYGVAGWIYDKLKTVE